MASLNFQKQFPNLFLYSKISEILPLFFKLTFLLEYVVLASTLQQNESATYTQISPPFWISFIQLTTVHELELPITFIFKDSLYS